MTLSLEETKELRGQLPKLLKSGDQEKNLRDVQMALTRGSRIVKSALILNSVNAGIIALAISSGSGGTIFITSAFVTIFGILGGNAGFISDGGWYSESLETRYKFRNRNDKLKSAERILISIVQENKVHNSINEVDTSLKEPGKTNEDIVRNVNNAVNSLTTATETLDRMFDQEMAALRDGYKSARTDVLGSQLWQKTAGVVAAFFQSAEDVRKKQISIVQGMTEETKIAAANLRDINTNYNLVTEKANEAREQVDQIIADVEQSSDPDAMTLRFLETYKKALFEMPERIAERQTIIAENMEGLDRAEEEYTLLQIAATLPDWLTKTQAQIGNSMEKLKITMEVEQAPAVDLAEAIAERPALTYDPQTAGQPLDMTTRELAAHYAPR